MIINRKDFARALSFATRVLDKKNVIPILSSVKLTLTDSLKVSATNLDSSFETQIEASGEPFDVRVDTKVLAGLIPRLSGDTVEIEVGKQFVIKRKSGDIRLKMVALTDEPEMVDFDVPMVAKFSKGSLDEAFQGVLCGTSEDRVLQGFRNVVQFTFDEGFMCVSSDSQRIAFVKGDVEILDAQELLIPLPAVRTILASDIEDVTIGQSANHIVVVGEREKFAFRKMDIKYPNIKQVFNNLDFKYKCTVDAREFNASLELVNTMADPRLRSARWIMDGTGIRLNAVSAESGEIDELVETVGLPEIKTKYSLDYTNPIFRQLEGNVEIAFAELADKDKDGNEIFTYPMRITKDANTSLSFIVQSMRF